MSRVYLAYDPDLDRDVAIKVLAGVFGVNQETREGFLREARIIGRLRNDAIVQVHFLGEEEGQLYLVMEHMESGSLSERLQGRPLLPSQAIAVLRRVAGALDAAHQAGVIHRDIKPANILFDAEDRAFVSDFGVAGLADSGTMAGQATHLSGTPTYMSPEQAQGQRTSASSDLYSLAATAFEVLTGQPPFVAPTLIALISAHIQQSAPLASSINPSLGPEVDAVLNRGLAKAPAERYASGTAFVAALAEAIRRRAPGAAGEAPSTAAVTPAASVSRPAVTPAAFQPSAPAIVPVPDTAPPAPYHPPAAFQPPAYQPPASGGQQTVVEARGAGGSRPGGELTGELRFAGNTRGWLLGRRTPEFRVTLWNTAAWPVQVTLDVSTDAARYRGEPVAPLVVPAQGAATTRVRISDRGSRLAGGRSRHYVSVVASPSGGGLPPIALSGTFDESPDRMPLVVAGGALLGLLAGAGTGVALTRGGGDEPPPATRTPTRTATRAPTSTTSTATETATRTATVVPTVGPSAPSIVSLNWPAQIARGTSAGFDLVIKDANGDATTVEFTETGDVTWSGPNVDATGKIITTTITATAAEQRAGTAKFRDTFNCNSPFTSRFQIAVIDSRGLRSVISVAAWTCK